MFHFTILKTAPIKKTQFHETFTGDSSRIYIKIQLYNKILAEILFFCT